MDDLENGCIWGRTYYSIGVLRLIQEPISGFLWLIRVDNVAGIVFCLYGSANGSKVCRFRVSEDARNIAGQTLNISSGAAIEID